MQFNLVKVEEKDKNIIYHLMQLYMYELSFQTGNGLCGNSKFIDYEGKIMKELGKEEKILTVDLDLEKQEKYRIDFPVLQQI